MAFKFVGRVLNLIEDPIDAFGVVAGGDYFVGRSLLFEVHLKDRVHQFVRRQAILVELIRCELCGRQFVDDLVRDYLASGRFVDVARNLPHLRLEQIAKYGKAAVRVAIERAITDRELAFIAGREQ